MGYLEKEFLDFRDTKLRELETVLISKNYRVLPFLENGLYETIFFDMPETVTFFATIHEFQRHDNSHSKVGEGSLIELSKINDFSTGIIEIVKNEQKWIDINEKEPTQLKIIKPIGYGFQ